MLIKIDKEYPSVRPTDPSHFVIIFYLQLESLREKKERNIWIPQSATDNNFVDDIVHNVVYENVKLFIGFEHGCQTTFDEIKILFIPT